jgi:hypothetical protein
MGERGAEISCIDMNIFALTKLARQHQQKINNTATNQTSIPKIAKK